MEFIETGVVEMVDGFQRGLKIFSGDEPLGKGIQDMHGRSSRKPKVKLRLCLSHSFINNIHSVWQKGIKSLKNYDIMATRAFKNIEIEGALEYTIVNSRR